MNSEKATDTCHQLKAKADIAICMVPPGVENIYSWYTYKVYCTPPLRKLLKYGFKSKNIKTKLKRKCKRKPFQTFFANQRNSNFKTGRQK